MKIYSDAAVTKDDLTALRLAVDNKISNLTFYLCLAVALDLVLTGVTFGVMFSHFGV